MVKDLCWECPSKNILDVVLDLDIAPDGTALADGGHLCRGLLQLVQVPGGNHHFASLK